MRTFTTHRDGTAVPWSIDVTTGTLTRIQQATGVNLYDNPLAVPANLAELSDVATLLGVLYTACQGQAVASGVTLEQFADEMTADDLRGAVDVLMEELADFFSRLRPGQGELFRHMWQNSREIEGAIREAVSDPV